MTTETVACKLTLDPNTAGKHLLLSEGNRKVTRVEERQPYLDKPDRFTEYQVLSREPLTGRCYWEFACKLTLDPNTAHKRLLLSEGNRKVTRVKEWQPYPDHPDRFTLSPQVLSREPLTGRCYWECEWGGDYFEMGVAYQSTDRGSTLTSSDKSWLLRVHENKYYVFHYPVSADVAVPPSRSSRVGVFLDREACTLSFYSVCSDTLTHLYTFYTRFTDEPLYAAFWVAYGSSVTLC